MNFDELMEATRELREKAPYIVARFVAEPATMAHFHRLMRAAGVEYREATSLYDMLAGIPFIEDPSIRRRFIEGRSHEGRVIKLFVLMDDGQLFELTGIPFDQYRGVTYFPHYDWSPE